ncbi:MAG: hypothetical protein D6805_03050 [Planctomycetota bacterium]|nr:MAG: hypothetical protein D6805_03050 [Planctomycetota bacterium]
MVEAFQEGKELLQEGLVEEAISHLNLAIVNNPCLWEAYFYLAKAYYWTGKNKEEREDLLKSYETLLKLQQLHPATFAEKKVTSLFHKVRGELEKRGMVIPDEASIAESTLVSDPRETTSHYTVSLHKREGPATRILRYRRLLSQDPANLLALSHLAQALEENNATLQAQKTYEQLISYALGLDHSLSEQQLYSLENLQGGVHWWIENVFDQGDGELETKALAQAMIQLARILRRQGKWNKASWLYTAALDLGKQTGLLPCLQDTFNEYLESCIQSQNYPLAKERLPELKNLSNLDEVLIALIESWNK